MHYNARLSAKTRKCSGDGQPLPDTSHWGGEGETPSSDPTPPRHLRRLGFRASGAHTRRLPVTPSDPPPMERSLGGIEPICSFEIGGIDAPAIGCIISYTCFIALLFFK